MGSSDPIVMVDNGNWGATSLTAVGAVLEPTARVLCDAFGRRPDAPVRVSPWDQAPRVAWDLRPYRVWINARDTYWCQYAYQFAHGLCHILVNFDQVRHHRHKWFEESICELASLFALHRLSGKFQTGPPSGVLGARDYAPHFEAYARQVESRVQSVPTSGLPVWLSGNIRRLEECSIDRDLNRVVAVALLDDFLADHSLWRDCGFLNRWNAQTDRTFADHIDSWTDFLRGTGCVPRTPRLVKNLLFATGQRGRGVAGDVKRGGRRR